MRSGQHSHGFWRTAVASALLLSMSSGEENKESKSPERLRGFLGVSTAPVPEAVRAQVILEDGFGLSVLFVMPGGPVDRVGVKRYDILVSFDDQKLTTSAGLAALSASKSPGDEVVLTALRKGAERTFPIVLGDRRDAPEAIAPMFAEDLPMSDLVGQLFERQGSMLQLEFSDDGGIQLRVDEALGGIRGLFDLLKRQVPGEGFIWEPRLLDREPIGIKTDHYDVWVTTGIGGEVTVVAVDRATGAAAYSGPAEALPGKEIPAEVKLAIEAALKERH
jgi:hypothetical protein